MITLTWHACKYKVHKLHQRYILKKGCPSVAYIYIYIYPTLQAHSVTLVCTGIRQNQFLFKTGHSPLISKLVQHINTSLYYMHTHIHTLASE